MSLSLQELLSYALGAQVPRGFAHHLLRRRERWDAEFERRLDELAYEFRPDLAVWELIVNDEGVLIERRIPLLIDFVD
ncbi:MAG: hypothetical protein JSV66_02915 [Trueperaceae bacterium]|nr:MAG: hypothetical protein JSV66_02915 [Trueperaceae bacterium]